MISAFIIVALSADGFSGKSEEEASTSWTSKEDTKNFVALTKRAGVVVMGSKTYETFGKPLKERKNIVYSWSKKYEGVEVTSETPAVLLARLEKEGFKEVAICGGSSIYTMFLESGLVDRLYISVINKMFGTGLPFLTREVDVSLALVSNTKLGENTVLLEYKVNH